MLLFFLGLALAGQFEIGLSLTSAGGSLAQKHGYAGSFFTGVLAMVVATPCTAPFMGAAIGYALSHSAFVSFTVFTALALGLALPYLALAYFPGLGAHPPQARRVDGSPQASRLHPHLRDGHLARLGLHPNRRNQRPHRPSRRLPASCHRRMVPRPLARQSRSPRSSPRSS